jgi:hypothetical protein
MLLTEGANYGFCVSQVWSWHTGEKMMLYLIVKSTEYSLRQQSAMDISRRVQLSPEKVTFTGIMLYLHSLMVWSDDTAEVHAEQALMHYHENNRAHGWENQEYCCHIYGDMHEKQAGLRNATTSP